MGELGAEAALATALVSVTPVTAKIPAKADITKRLRILEFAEVLMVSTVTIGPVHAWAWV